MEETMNTQPMISVVMPVYNCRDYLPEALSSVLTQSFEDFELIAVDDGSTDGSREYLESQTDPRIRLLSTGGTASGPGVARNVAIQHAKGTYLVTMDADDISMPRRFELLLEQMKKHPDAVMCGSSINVFQEKGVKHMYPKSITHENVMQSYMEVAIHSTIIRRDIVVENDLTYPALYFAEDWVFAYMIARFGKVLNVPDVLYHYRWYGYGRGAKDGERVAAGRLGAIRLILKDYLKREPTDREVELHAHFVSPHLHIVKLSAAHLVWIIKIGIRLRTMSGRVMLVRRCCRLLMCHVRQLRG